MSSARSQSEHPADGLRRFFRDPIPEIELCAHLLELAFTAHAKGRSDLAEKLFDAANSKIVWEWLNSIWGALSPYTGYRKVDHAPPYMPERQRSQPRYPSTAMKAAIHQRDGHYCRSCGIPVVRAKIRDRARRLYPRAVPWGPGNANQHAAFQCMWAQYDHVIPHSRGGQTTMDNLLLTCAACNYGRGSYTLEEVGIANPFLFEPRQGEWDGLERWIHL